MRGHRSNWGVTREQLLPSQPSIKVKEHEQRGHRPDRRGPEGNTPTQPAQHSITRRRHHAHKDIGHDADADDKIQVEK